MILEGIHTVKDIAKARQKYPAKLSVTLLEEHYPHLLIHQKLNLSQDFDMHAMMVLRQFFTNSKCLALNLSCCR